ncbi:Uncharacterized protein in dcmA 3'region [Cytospora mali]|uniref:Uncharacterized protein in dcmA 3'region n=1 Tax=Cytospora mali TaxID=578113 RepID=A0A194VES9_CYTMA|nr:Uncharacterized protein in dcmA 3'region [Valsa mali var. pyri (nom. inval.)]
MNYYPADSGPPIPVVVSATTVTNKRPSIATAVTVHDITGYESEYDLDKNGFQLVRHVSEEKVFIDEDRITSLYYAEIERLLEDITGASRVVIFNHRVRRGPSDWHNAGMNNRLNAGPLFKVHIDQSYDGAELQLRSLLPGEADELVKQRYQIVNVWRPIKTVLRDPLAVADARSVSDEDLLPASVIKPNSRSETWTVRPNSAHRWFFKYKQQPDEVMVIKCFDSSESVARRVPHSAFKDRDHDEEPHRESIEVRAILLY